MEYSQYCQNAASELRISDCSSDDENWLCRRAKTNRSDSDELDTTIITWSSDDELGTENCQSLLNRSFIERSAVTPVTRKYSSSARKSKLPNLSVKRKLSKVIEYLPEVRTTLGTKNVPANVANNSNRSPWCKVRKTFATLRRHTSYPAVDDCVANNENTTALKRLSTQKSDGTSIEWSSSSSESDSPKRLTNSGTVTTQKSTAPTELELLVALIERENAAAKTLSTANKQKKKLKRAVPGGYVERLQKLEEANRIESNFLQHDQQLGLQSGTRMRVLQIIQVCGVHMATVQLEQNDESTPSDEATATMRIVIDADMAAHVKVGSRIEAFFDANIKPYTIVQESDVTAKEVIYVQPHKLLLL